MQVAKPKKGYKLVKTSFGKYEEIPEEWEETTIQNVTELFSSGIWGDDCTKKEKCYPVIRSTEINYDDGRLNLKTVAYRKIPQKKHDKYLLNSDDILIVASSGSERLIGRIGYFQKSNDEKYFFSNFMLRLRTKNIESKYLHYFLQSNPYSNFLKQMQQTTSGLRNFPTNDFLQLKFPLPPLPEQKQISLILSNVDDTLQKTNRIIEQTQLLKKGMMQKLLTRGIGHTKFKKVKWYFGKDIEIPEEWKIVKISNATKAHKQGFYTDQSYSEKGIRLVRITDLQNPTITYDTMPLLELDEKIINDFRINIDDFLVARSGGIGRYGIVKDDIPCVFGSYIIRFVFDQKIVDNDYFGYLFESEIIKKELARIQQKSTNININAENIKSIQVYIPKLKEQKQIASILSNVDTQIQKERLHKSNLERLKKGLMQKLLTGQIRVKV